MTIHHATIKKAEKMGLTIEEQGDTFRVFWPKRAVEIYGVSPTDAMAQAAAVQTMLTDDPAIHIVNEAGDPRRVFVRKGDTYLVGCPTTPHEAHQMILQGKAVWELEADDPFGDSPKPEQAADTTSTPTEAAPVVERSENGIALDGGVAYREGTAAGDNPYTSETESDEEYENFQRWDEEWDAAADAADAEEESKGGSVVNERYRTKYAELGHPTHCGDWLANLLNNLCLTKEGTDLGRFETICGANGLDLSKYNRTTPGWQGRLRMTGRNLLAKRVYFAGGVVKTPVDGAEPEYKAPSDWMTTQRFKMPKADQAKPIPEAATETVPAA